MIQDTATRVQQQTAPHVNDRIQRELQEQVARFESGDRTVLISQRLNELDREWDIERALQANFAVLSLAGVMLAARGKKRWSALAMVVPAFMVQHALQGWCPPLPIMRRLGFRTSKEINEERFALKSLRGDFTDAARSGKAEDLYKAVKA